MLSERNGKFGVVFESFVSWGVGLESGKSVLDEMFRSGSWWAVDEKWKTIIKGQFGHFDCVA